MFQGVIQLCFATISIAVTTAAFAEPPEENFLISNGQGIVSPSFTDGLSGENPAGLTYNDSFKLQAFSAGFNGVMQTTRQSGAILVGNGNLGAGLEYSSFTERPLPAGSARVNWGIGGFFKDINTRIGVSAHQDAPGKGTYDIGMIVEPLSWIRVGMMLPNVTNGFNYFGGGLAFSLPIPFDIVVDAAYQPRSGNGTIKPGLNFNFWKIHASAAYGLRFLGTNTAWLLPKLSAGVGIVLIKNLLASYEYKGFPEHRLGLTLRFNSSIF